MSKELVDKVAIVTGATRNQGRAFSQMLASHGANVVVHHRGSKSKAEAEETAELVRNCGGKALIVEADLTRLSDVRRLFDVTEKQFKRLDILINNAGMVIKKLFVEVTEEDYDRSFAINTKAAFFCMQEAAKRMADGGRIVNIGTTLLAATTGYYSVYAGSKAPLEDFSRALAREIGHRGITVNVVAPGPLNTSFFYPAETPESVEYLKNASVHGRLGEVNEIVPLIEFLVSPKSGWVTAQTMFINGGFVAR